ncbi:DNA-processing protein DprA [Patulibacter sp.]|uniref:DNA-processing protein DprA n=1 Tax=Patulibacter sp. TaxID=1912859 RepID=UPI00272777D6|nr:DNA-protecting protein DprA [Patulibacter sp.]MDO9410922.1 DNA-protecting protein DprA [Patulibacter sp.]
MRACVDCLRMAQLLGELTPGLDRPAARIPLVLSLEPDELAFAVNGPRGPRARTLDRSADDLLSGADRDLRELGVEAVCVHHADYPARLLDLRDPPAVLHVLGGIDRLRRVLGPRADGPTVGMVGTRRPPEDAVRIARRFAEAVAGGGITVVSGMAFGIDAASHEGALAAGSPGPPDEGAGRGGRRGGTVAVLAAGVERATPARLRHLYDRIAADGVVVGELPPGATPRRWSFPARNRLIAALGDGLVVVAAGRSSGSLRSVEHARALDRPVGIVPGSILDPRYAGGNDVLRGADLLAGEDDEGRVLTRAIVEPDDVRAMLHADRLRLRFGPTGPGGPDTLEEAEERPGADDRDLAARARREARAAGLEPAPLLEAEIPPADPLSGLEGEARAIAERLAAGPRTIESLIAESDPATILAGLGALEADGRLRRSLSGTLELTTGPGGTGTGGGEGAGRGPSRGGRAR